MLRQRIPIFAFVLLLITSLACNYLAGEPTAAPPAPPAASATPAGADTTAAPTPEDGTLAPTATAGTPQPGGATLTALVDVNVRTGPGTVFAQDGYLLEGESATITGRDPDSGWWKVDCPPRATGPDCWITGRAQYVAVENTGGVPIAQVPPTPTPQPTATATATAEPEPAAAPLLAYVQNGDLFALPLAVSETSISGREAIQITQGNDVRTAHISPDGRKIAFVRDLPDGHRELAVINRDGSSLTALVNSRNLPPLPNQLEDLQRVIGIVRWLPDSRTVAFNTALVSTGGPGLGSNEDLWLVQPGNPPQERFGPDMGGGAFAFSPDGQQVLMSTGTDVARANVDGSNRETLITFPGINTASEYIYYPQPQWTADGSAAYVAIPGENPWEEGASAALWRIPAGGAAAGLSEIRGNILFHPVDWTRDGSRLAYVQQIIDTTNPPAKLMLGDGTGNNLQEYAQGEQLTLFGWSPDQTHFLYSGNEYYAVGAPGAAPFTANVPAGASVRDGQWLTRSLFVVAAGSHDGGWRLLGGNLTGDRFPLATVGTVVPTFDVWAP